MTGDAPALVPPELARDFLERQAAVLVLRVDAEGTILGANRFARELTGRPLVGSSLRDLLIVSAREPDLARWLTPSEKPRLMNVGTCGPLTQTLQVTTVRSGGELWLLGQVDPLEQDRLRQELIDINTELAGLGRELSLANAELARLDTLKNRFLGMASHDLRKPVGLILSRAELLLQDPAVLAGAEACRGIQGIAGWAASMARLIDGFLDVGTIESGRLYLDIQPCRQDQLVAAAWELLQPAAAQRQVTLRTLLDPAAARLLVDAGKLEQVLANLLDNAVEHSPEGGCVTLATEVVADGVRFRVTDQGEGLSAEARRRFAAGVPGAVQRGRNGERRLGLGLVIVRQIVAAHGGSCLVEDREGEGAVLSFLLPGACLAQAENAAPKRVPGETS